MAEVNPDDFAADPHDAGDDGGCLGVSGTMLSLPPSLYPPAAAATPSGSGSTSPRSTSLHLHHHQQQQQQQPDLSHLTEEERAIIENVMSRQQDEENREATLLR